MEAHIHGYQITTDDMLGRAEDGENTLTEDGGFEQSRTTLINHTLTYQSTGCITRAQPSVTVYIIRPERVPPCRLTVRRPALYKKIMASKSGTWLVH